MSKARILLILGTWIVILPYLGFPSSWKDALCSLSGLVLIYFSYVLYKSSKTKENPKKTFDNFKENNVFSEDNIGTMGEKPQEHINQQKI